MVLATTPTPIWITTVSATSWNYRPVPIRVIVTRYRQISTVTVFRMFSTTIWTAMAWPTRAISIRRMRVNRPTLTATVCRIIRMSMRMAMAFPMYSKCIWAPTRWMLRANRPTLTTTLCPTPLIPTATATVPKTALMHFRMTRRSGVIRMVMASVITPTPTATTMVSVMILNNRPAATTSTR